MLIFIGNDDPEPDEMPRIIEQSVICWLCVAIIAIGIVVGALLLVIPVEGLP